MTRGILAASYTSVKPRATQNVMIPPASINRFGLLLKDVREARGLSQADVGEALGVDRSLISQWERGVAKRPVAVDDVNHLFELTGVPVLDWVIALGYVIRLNGIEDEAAAVLLGAYLSSSDDRRQIAQLALGLGPVHSGDPRLESLRRLSAMDRQDRQESRE